MDHRPRGRPARVEHGIRPGECFIVGKLPAPRLVPAIRTESGLIFRRPVTRESGKDRVSD
jgi:hypothetical protein